MIFSRNFKQAKPAEGYVNPYQPGEVSASWVKIIYGIDRQANK